MLPNTCECYPGFDGTACKTTAKPNLYAPVFVAPMHNVSVSENVSMGRKILRVHLAYRDVILHAGRWVRLPLYI